MKYHIYIFTALFVLTHGLAYSATIRVPADIDNIQSAIEVAQDGDSILVADGTYVKRLDFLGKALVVQGNIENPERVIIRTDIVSSIVNFQNGEPETAVLCGVTVRGGSTDFGGGIYVKNASPTLHHLIVDSNSASDTGGGIYFTGECNSSIRNISLKANRAQSGGGIGISGNSNVVTDSITISSCQSTKYGGGIYVKDAFPTFNHTTIDCCVAGKNGGGMYFTGIASIVANHTLLSRNSTKGSTNGAGGMSCCNQGVVTATDCIVSSCTGGVSGGIEVFNKAQLTLQKFLFDKNLSKCGYGSALFRAQGGRIALEDGIVRNQLGSSIYLADGPPCTLHKVLCEGNQGDLFTIDSYELVTVSSWTVIQNGGRVVNRHRGSIQLKNSIIWKSGGPALGGKLDLGSIRISYSDVSDLDEWKMNTEKLGNGVISRDPFFKDSTNGDYTLSWNSPCLHAGDPLSPKDADSSTVEMGCYTVLDFLSAKGQVTTMEREPRPLAGATITTNFGFVTVTDDQGNYSIPAVPLGPLSITASLPGFLDSTSTLVRAPNLAVVRNFQLTAPRLIAEVERFGAKLEMNSQADFDLTVKNDGIGPLRWQIVPTIGDGWIKTPWKLANSIKLPEMQGTIVLGVALCQNHLLLSCRHGSDGFFLVTDLLGVEVARFPQPGDSTTFFTDLDSDGERVFGNKGKTVYTISLEGEISELFPWVGEESSAITWDEERGLLWLVEKSPRSPILGYDLSGNLVYTIEKPPLFIMGLSFWKDEPEGFQLHALSRTDSQYILTQFNIDNPATRLAGYLGPPDGWIPKTCFITDKIAPYNSVALLTPVKGRNGNLIDCWSVWTNIGWINVNPADQAGVLQAGDEHTIKLSVSTNALTEGEYKADLNLQHTGINDPKIIPLTLTVLPEVSVNGDAQTLPAEFAVTSLYPNPFNARLNIAYSLPTAGDVTLALYDLSGREVFSQPDFGIQAGTHNLSISATQLPTGVYLVKLHSSH